MPCPFASPRNKEGSHTPSPRSGACSTGERRDKLSRVLKRSRPRRPTPRHPEFGRLEISLRQGEEHSTGGFSPKDKVRFWFAVISAQCLEPALNLFSGAPEKSGGLASEIHRSRLLEADEVRVPRVRRGSSPADAVRQLLALQQAHVRTERLIASAHMRAGLGPRLRGGNGRGRCGKRLAVVQRIRVSGCAGPPENKKDALR